ncbi:hypothetical protein [Thalassotalea euphylliae]|uniref:Uncharacterized protein n=1 Tax=Thalassotalea euphylliae TaxID=1655234 RepID=A0A3E0UE24_9GAMM|nr:hypothetical protein [Thalassotalea euphylliae]REL34823.1 hypothetical protein DXX92_05310 [Thalassotalea euphylliae]
MASQIEQIAKEAQQVANAFRLGYEGEASTLYIDFIDALTALLAAHSLTGNRVFNELFQVMIDAHKRGDKLFLADILQYEMPAILRQHIDESP